MSETKAIYEQAIPSAGRQSVTAALHALLDEREAKGIATYGRSLETFNGRSAPRDLVEELIDATQYALKWQIEREEMIKQNEELRAHVARLMVAMDYAQRASTLPDAVNALTVALLDTPETIAADAEVLRAAEELSTARRAYLRWLGIGPISDETHADWIIFLEAQEKLDAAVDRFRKAHDQSRIGVTR